MNKSKRCLCVYLFRLAFIATIDICDNRSWSNRATIRMLSTCIQVFSLNLLCGSGKSLYFCPCFDSKHYIYLLNRFTNCNLDQDDKSNNQSILEFTYSVDSS